MRIHSCSVFVAAVFMLCVTLAPHAQQSGRKSSIAGVVFREGTDEPIEGVLVTAQQIRPSQLDTMTRAAAAGLTFNQYLAANGGTPGGAGGGAPSNAPPRPVPDSNVVAESSPIIVTAATDAQGRFLITGLDEGAYLVRAAKDGYATQPYGQLPGALAVSKPIHLNSGEELKNIILRLTQTGSISGHVQDSSGRPAVGTPVQLFTVGYSADGIRRFRLQGTVITNDHGDYRLFWIVPGAYYLVAGDDTAAVSDRVPSPSSVPYGTSPNAVPGQEYAMTFYPGTTNVNEASLIDVPAGQDLKGVDFRVRAKQTHSIRGRAIDASTGAPPPSLSVQLRAMRLRGYSGEPVSTTGYISATGEFEVANVFPGSYELLVNTRGASTRMTVQVADSDVNGVNVRFTKAALLNVRLSIEGLPQYPLEMLDPLSAQLSPSENGILTPDNSLYSTSPDSSGKMQFEGIASGEFRLSMANLPTEFYIKEIRYQGRDALNEAIVFAAGSTDSLEILISPKPAEISGAVLDDKRRPAEKIKVVLVPDERRNRVDLFRTVVTDAQGRFTIAGITPGSYKLFAWQSIEPFSYFDPNVVKRYEQQGVALHLDESAKQAVTLNLIPAGQ